jgi:hypothetical protein
MSCDVIFMDRYRFWEKLEPMCHMG